MSQTSLFGRDPISAGAGEATGDGEAGASTPAPDGARPCTPTEALPDLAEDTNVLETIRAESPGEEWHE